MWGPWHLIPSKSGTGGMGGICPPPTLKSNGTSYVLVPPTYKSASSDDRVDLIGYIDVNQEVLSDGVSYAVSTGLYSDVDLRWVVVKGAVAPIFYNGARR